MFSTSYVSFFIVFAFVAYLIAVDDSVAAAVNFISKLARIEYEKRKWWLLHNPRNPIVKYLIWRRAMKLAKEIQNEIDMERRSKESNDHRTTAE